MSPQATKLVAVVGAGLLLAGCASGTAVTARPAPFPSAPDRVADRASARPAPEAAPAATPATPGPMASAVLETALALRGTRYQLGGTQPKPGFDCSGFVQYVFLQHHVALPRTVAEQFQVGRGIESDPIAAGDLIFFSTVTPGASHVGIALDGDTFVHAPGSGSVVRLERLDAPYWRARFVGVKRLLALSIAGG